MITLKLTPSDIRTAALALAENARRTPQGDPSSSVSRALARSLSEHVGAVVETLFLARETEAALLSGALRRAAVTTPYYPTHGLRGADYLALAGRVDRARLGA